MCIRGKRWPTKPLVHRERAKLATEDWRGGERERERHHFHCTTSRKIPSFRRKSLCPLFIHPGDVL